MKENKIDIKEAIDNFVKTLVIVLILGLLVGYSYGYMTAKKDYETKIELNNNEIKELKYNYDLLSDSIVYINFELYRLQENEKEIENNIRNNNPDYNIELFFESTK